MPLFYFGWSLAKPPLTELACLIDEDDVLVTGNLGSRANENFCPMRAGWFLISTNKKWPLMCRASGMAGSIAGMNHYSERPR